MAGSKKINSDLDIQGKIILTDVPNNTGALVTYNVTSKTLSQRTNAQILSDLDLITATNIAANYYNKTNLQTSGQAQVNWGNLTNVPGTFPATAHTHDDRYYTETESDTKFVPYTGATKALNLGANNLELGVGGVLSKNQSSSKILNKVYQADISATVTGILSIKFVQQVTTGTMFDITIKIYSYGSSFLGELRISFYKISGTSIHTSGAKAIIKGTSNFPLNTVQVGIDGSNNVCINLGSVATAWGNYLSFEVSRVEAKYGGINADWSLGWSHSIETVAPALVASGGTYVSILNNASFATEFIDTHTHTNKANLDTINQNLGTSHSPTFNIPVSTSSIVSRLGSFGTYNAAQTQNVWSMGTAYNVSASTTTLGNLYGLAYSYISVGGSSVASKHQIHFAENGTARITMNMTDGEVRAERLTSRVATGTSPMSIASTTLVSNLNADMIDGVHSAQMFTASSISTGFPLVENQFGFINGATSNLGGIASWVGNWINIGSATANQHKSQLLVSKTALKFRTMYGTADDAAFLTVWHDGNDGAGSGLDADMLDGIQASVFLQHNMNYDTLGNNLNWDTLVYAGQRLIIQPIHTANYTGVTNDPGMSYGTVITFPRDLTGSTFGHQLAFDFYGGLAIRSSNTPDNLFTEDWLRLLDVNTGVTRAGYQEITGTKTFQGRSIPTTSGIIVEAAGGSTTENPTLAFLAHGRDWGGLQFDGTKFKLVNYNNTDYKSLYLHSILGVGTSHFKSYTIDNTDADASGGAISLYGGGTYSGSGVPPYGLGFFRTTYLGTHGAVTGDYATYFTISGPAGRGWIFRDETNGNVASVSNTGVITANSFKKIGGTATQKLMADGSTKEEITVKTIATSTYTVVPGDADNLIIFTAANVVVTVTNASLTTAGQAVQLEFLGTGSLTVTGSGATILVNQNRAAVSDGQNSTMVIQKLTTEATSKYKLYGELV